MELDPEGWEQWLSGRPAMIQDMARKYPPNHVYRMNTGHRCRIVAYDESGTVRVVILQIDNPHVLLVFERSVFGVDPETMEVDDDKMDA